MSTSDPQDDSAGQVFRIQYPARCESCRYDLRGTSVEYCPECGATLYIVVKHDESMGPLEALDDRLQDLGVPTRLYSVPPQVGSLPLLLGLPESGPRNLLFVPVAHDRLVRDLAAKMGEEVARPLVARAEPICPRCRTSLDPLRDPQCPNCELEFHWIADDELGVTEASLSPRTRGNSRSFWGGLMVTGGIVFSVVALSRARPDSIAIDNGNIVFIVIGVFLILGGAGLLRPKRPADNATSA